MKTYQKDENGNFQDGATTIPADPRNSDYRELVKAIDNGDAEVVEYDPAPALAIQEASEALEELQLSDWYVIREFETGKAIPDDIKSKRAAARLKADKRKGK